MARITREMVFEAADKLTAQGKEPTITGIRDDLGGGSFSTISGHLKKWRNQKQSVESVALPDAVREVFRSSFNAVWSEAERLHSEQVLVMREQFAQERDGYTKEAEEELSRLEKLVEQLKQEAASLADKNTTLIRDAATAEANAKSSEKEASTLTGKLSALDAEHRLLIKQVGGLEKEVETLRGQQAEKSVSKRATSKKESTAET